jgi:hypothetical protein
MELTEAEHVGQTAGAPYAPQLGTASADVVSTALQAQRSGSARAASSGQVAQDRVGACGIRTSYAPLQLQKRTGETVQSLAQPAAQQAQSPRAAVARQLQRERSTEEAR